MGDIDARKEQNMENTNIKVLIANERIDEAPFEIELPMEPKKLVETLKEHGIGLDDADGVSETEMESLGADGWSIRSVLEAPEAIEETLADETDLCVINDLAALYFDADEQNLEALELYKDELYTPSSKDLLNLLKMDVDDLGYHGYAHGDADDSAAERYGKEVFFGSELASELEERGLASYFDLESYGEDMGADAYLGNDGYFLEAPDLDLFDLEELHELAELAGYERPRETSYDLAGIAGQAMESARSASIDAPQTGRDAR